MSPAIEQELELARLSSELKRQGAQRSLATKTLEVLLVTKFVYEYGFQNGRLVAERIVEDILATIQDYWVPAADVHEPGSFTALAVSKDAVPGPYPLRLEETPHVPVQLRLTTEDERKRIAEGRLRSPELRRERAIRFFFEAEEQGGLLTLADVAWFVGVSVHAMSTWVRAYQAETGQIVPTRGTVHDLGRGTTHKRMIVRHYLDGKLPSEVARLSRHAQKNVDRYIAGFERVRLLSRDHSPEAIPALAGMSRSLVGEYLRLLEDLTDETHSTAPEGPRSSQPPSNPARTEIAAPAAPPGPADS
jgi:transposase-like protein